MAVKPTRRKLRSILDPDAAEPLATMLRGIRGKSVVLDASAVERLSVPAVQILISAAGTWRADGQTLALADPSEGFSRTLAGLAIPLSALEAGD